MRTIFFIGKAEEKRTLERQRRRWEDNVRMDLMEIVWERVDWMHVTQDTNH
jgi:hypothetical protein